MLGEMAQTQMSIINLMDWRYSRSYLY